MSTIYGTISTASPPPAAPDSPFLSRAGRRIRSGVGTRRPWGTMLSHLSLPESPGAALRRLRANAGHYHANYAVVALAALFATLLWRPAELIAFVGAMFAWLYFYFCRDRPVVVRGYAVEERVVLAALSAATVGLLLLLARDALFLAGIGAGIAASLVHAVFRSTADIDLGDEEVGGGGGGAAVGLKETASDTYSVL